MSLKSAIEFDKLVGRYLYTSNQILLQIVKVHTSYQILEINQGITTELIKFN